MLSTLEALDPIAVRAQKLEIVGDSFIYVVELKGAYVVEAATATLTAHSKEFLLPASAAIFYTVFLPQLPGDC